MNGRIWIDSAVGKGCSFHFVVEFELGQTPHEDDDAHDADLAGVAILVVDDNETNRRILRQMLERWGMCVSTAASGREAMKRLREQRERGESLPLLLSDVHMPAMDGFMLAEALRSDPDFADITIVLLTSGGRPGDVLRCDRLNIKSQLMKPAKQSELFTAIANAAGKKLAALNIQGSEEDQLSLPKLKVLLVEDGKANQILARGLLNKWGHDVVVAENGEKAVSCWQQQPFDLILMDVQMPVMDGLEATRQIREQEARNGKHIPIVAMTARAMKGDREDCLEAGMDEYVAKPVRKRELFASLRRFFSAGDTTIGQATSALPSLIDWKQALETSADDADMLRDVATATAQELRELLETLNRSVEECDDEVTERAAHTIKSSSRILAAAALTDVAAETEEAAMSADRRRIEAGARRLGELIPLMLDEIDAFLNTVHESN